MPELKELPDCGKRYVRQRDEAKLSECFWNCQVFKNILNAWKDWLSSTFQWKRNPRYVAGGAKWFDFTEPLQELIPDFFLYYFNQIAIISGKPYLLNGKIWWQNGS